MNFKNIFFSTLLGLSLVACQNFNSAKGSNAAPEGHKTSSGASAHLNFEPKRDQLPFHPRGLDYDSTMSTLAFGSCANQDQPQPLWKTISDSNAQLFVFMGDNIYASSESQKPLKAQYQKLDKIPEYIAIREKVPFMAIWDDHDYGQNDGGADNPQKEEAKKDFLQYWRYVSDAIERNQQGLYHAKIFGPSNKLVQVIMLDTRWNRSPLVKSTVEGKKFEPTKDKKTTILGEEQWDWLEDELKEKADVRFIVSSIQVIPDGHTYEKWGNFPHEKERLFNLLKKTKAKNVVLLSGDRHIGSIAKTQIDGYGDLYEITASSINRPSNLEENDPTYLSPAFSKENFALANIDWENSKLTVELRNLKNEVVQSVDVPVKIEKRKPDPVKKEKKKKKRKKRRH